MAVAFQDLDPDDLRQRLEAYYRVYYAHLREMMSRYSAISEGFPYWLKGPKSILATLCADGVLVTHWEAPKIVLLLALPCVRPRRLPTSKPMAPTLSDRT